MLGAIGGALAGAVRKQAEVQPSWQSQVVDLRDLPPEVVNNPDWPVRKSKAPCHRVTYLTQVTHLTFPLGRLAGLPWDGFGTAQMSKISQ